MAALALLLAQLGAMNHAYSHVPRAGASSNQTQPLSGHEYCGDCLNFAPLLASAGAPEGIVLALPPPEPTLHTAAETVSPQLKPRLSFRSRAPPTPKAS